VIFFSTKPTISFHCQLFGRPIGRIFGHLKAFLTERVTIGMRGKIFRKGICNYDEINYLSKKQSLNEE